MRMPTQSICERKWFFTGEVARWLGGVPHHDVQTLFDRGELSGTKSPNGWRRISRESLVAYLRKHKIRAPGLWPSERKRLILMVEDHAEFRRSLQARLRRKFQKTAIIRSARNVGEAQEFVIKNKLPDLVILDLGFPEKKQQGDRFIEFLQDRPKGKKTKILVVTANRDASFHKNLLALGARKVIQKPVAFGHVIESSARLLFGERRKRRERRRPEYDVMT